MAIILRGLTECAICGSILQEDQSVRGFPPFVANAADPLYLFCDAGVHEDCFQDHPRREQVIERLAAIDALISPPGVIPRCRICAQELDWDNSWSLPFFTLDKSDPLFEFNCAEFHKVCLAAWNRRSELCGYLVGLKETWTGPHLEHVLHKVGCTETQTP